MVEPGEDFGEAGSGDGVDEPLIAHEALARIEAQRDVLDEQGAGAGVGFAAVALEGVGAAGGGGQREGAVGAAAFGEGSTGGAAQVVGGVGA